MKKLAGFTLTEIMITVAIVGILAAIAYPSYLYQVRKARRANAQAALLELVQFMERSYTVNLRYDDPNNPGNPPPNFPFICVPTDWTTDDQCEANGYYKLDLAPPPTATTFTLIAKPVPGSTQANDECGTLTLDNTGVKCIGDGTTCSNQANAVAAVISCWGR